MILNNPNLWNSVSGNQLMSRLSHGGLQTTKGDGGCRGKPTVAANVRGGTAERIDKEVPTSSINLLDGGMAQTTSKSRESVANEEMRQRDPTAEQSTMTASKVCECCGKDKGINEFAQDRRYPDGFHTVCRACNLEGRRTAARETTTGAGKFCSDCWEYKLMIAFGRRKKAPDDRSNKCRACDGVRDRKRREKLLQRDDVVPPKEKWCYFCGLTKSASEFNKRPNRLDGLQSYCVACVPAVVRANRTNLQQREDVEKPEEKRCLGCKVMKPASDFNAAGGRLDGLQCHCKLCKSAQRKAYQQKLRQREVLLPPENKRCPGCKLTKPACDYSMSRTNPDGLKGWCKSCDSAKRKKARAERGNKRRRKKSSSEEAM